MYMYCDRTNLHILLITLSACVAFKNPLCLRCDYSECLCCLQEFLCFCVVTCSSSLSLLSEKSFKGILTKTVAQENLDTDSCSKSLKRILTQMVVQNDSHTRNRNMYQTTSTNERSASRQTDSTDRFHSNMYKKQVHCSYMYMYIMLCCNSYDLNYKSSFCTKKHYQSFTLCTLRYFSHALSQSFK